MHIIITNRLTGTSLSLYNRAAAQAYQLVNQFSKAEGDVDVRVDVYPDSRAEVERDALARLFRRS